jgi:hypothetical protein
MRNAVLLLYKHLQCLGCEAGQQTATSSLAVGKLVTSADLKPHLLLCEINVNMSLVVKVSMAAAVAVAERQKAAA